MYLFINDERAFIEPHGDILSTALVVIGLIIFTALISKTYLAYEDNSLALDNYRQVAMIAKDVAKDPHLQGSRPDLLSAETLDALSSNENDINREFFHRFSANVDFLVEVRTDDGTHMWLIDKGPRVRKEGDIIASSVPVMIELGTNARCVPGTVTVRSMRTN